MAKTTTRSKAGRTNKANAKRGRSTTNASRRTTSTSRNAGRTGSRSGGRTGSRSGSSPKRVSVTLREKSNPTGDSMLGGKPMHSVTGQLVVDNAGEAITWYRKVFGAKELDRKPIMHAVLQIGDSAFMISDNLNGPPLGSELSGAYLHIQDRGLDGMWEKALANGAKPILPLANQFWGDRYGQMRDPFGQMWSLGWPAKMTEAEKAKLQKESMAQMAQQSQAA